MPTKVGKNVQETSKVKTTFGKNDMRYWEGKIYKLKFTEDGVQHESKQFSVKLQYRGERRNFPLGLANRSDAARRARDIYLSLIGRGWEETLAQYLPQCKKKEQQCKVGDFIASASKLAGVAPRTLACYISSLRMIAAGVAGISVGPSKFDYKNGGRDSWVEAVDAVSLEKLTPSAIESWKHRYLKSRKGNPVEERKAKNSVNSFIRQARSLFAPKIVKLVASDLRLPDPLPFQDVSLFPRSSMRYDSRIEIHKLVTAAHAELGAPQGSDENAEIYKSRTEQFKIFLLAAFGGLRRNEIDKLLWEQVDLKNGTVEVRETPHFKPKSEESHGLIKIEPEVASMLADFRMTSTGPFVIEATGTSKKHKSPQWYRAERHFGGLMEWLRKQGVDDLKPLHVLRKEAGSLICGAMGLYAASRFLRHGDVRVTAEHYLDKKSQVTVGMGALLRQTTENETPNEPKPA
jgi:integrase